VFPRHNGRVCRAEEAKARLRAELTAARAARDPAAIAAARSAVRRAVLARACAEGWQCVAGYVPLRTEPGSPELLTELARRGISVLVPLLLADRDLDWAPWRPDTAAAGAAVGRDALSAADAVLVPALAVATDGTRLGRGGGSYDRALPRARPDTVVAALLYDGELRAALPRDPWDQRVSAVVTPSGWQQLPAP
jgi:5-formyltetrahydrofolate cyclo-ligase